MNSKEEHDPRLVRIAKQTRTWTRSGEVVLQVTETRVFVRIWLALKFDSTQSYISASSIIDTVSNRLYNVIFLYLACIAVSCARIRQIGTVLPTSSAIIQYICNEPSVYTSIPLLHESNNIVRQHSYFDRNQQIKNPEEVAQEAEESLTKDSQSEITIPDKCKAHTTEFQPSLSEFEDMWAKYFGVVNAAKRRTELTSSSKRPFHSIPFRAGQTTRRLCCNEITETASGRS